MFALIKYKGESYYSPILAIGGKGWSGFVFALSSDLTRIVKIPMWDRTNHLHRLVFVIDSEKQNWIRTKGLEGHKNLFEKDNLRQIKHKKTPSGILSMLKDQAKSFSYPEWHTISGEKDVKDFYQLSLFLHDAYLTKVMDENDFKYVYINTTWDCFIILKCFKPSECNLETRITIRDDEHNFFFLPNGIKFKTELMGFFSGDESRFEKWIICKQMSYKLITDDDEIKKLKEECKNEEGI